MRQVGMGIILVALTFWLSACGKLGFVGTVTQQFGGWAEVNLPEGCKVKQIAAEAGSGVAILCEDGRVFH